MIAGKEGVLISHGGSDQEVQLGVMLPPAIGFEQLCLLFAQTLREEGADGDSYVPGRISFPAAADRIVQITAGEDLCAL